MTSTVKQELRFEKNQYLGAVFFSGGYISNQNKGMRIESKYTKLESSEKFSVWLKKKVDQMHFRVFKQLKNIKNVATTTAMNVKVHSEKDFSRHKDDGRDNINLPQLKYSFTSTIKPSADASYLLPIIEYAYGHNGGWFYGQEQGCSSGSRIAIYYLLFQNGRIDHTFRIEKKKLEKMNYKKSTFEVYQDMNEMLLKVEKELHEKIS